MLDRKIKYVTKVRLHYIKNIKININVDDIHFTVLINCRCTVSIIVILTRS